jgi:hypothetical protein
MPRVTDEGIRQIVSVPVNETTRRGMLTSQAYVSMGDNDVHVQVWYYNTLMLRFRRAKNGRKVITYLSTGYGSKHDQDNMNALFRILGVADRFYYSRKGGAAQIVDPRRYPFLPSYMRRWRDRMSPENWRKSLLTGRFDHLTEDERRALWA